MKNELPLISIIVPIYQVENYLNECIKSIVNQTYKNLEIILIDDGSKDNCPQICDEWKEKDNRIIVIHKENGGLSDARNKGIQIAKGEYFIFVDSDDYISHKMCQTLFNAINSTDIKLAICNFYRVKKRIKTAEWKLPNKNVISGKEALFYFLRGDNPIFHPSWNKIYHRSIFDNSEIRFPYGKLYEDGYVNYKLYGLLNKIILVKDCLYYYRTRPGSITQTPDERTITDLITRDKEVLEWVNSHMPDLNQVAVASAIRTYLSLTTLCYRYNLNKKEYCNDFFSYLRRYKEMSLSNQYLNRRNKKNLILSYLHIFRLGYRIRNRIKEFAS